MTAFTYCAYCEQTHEEPACDPDDAYAAEYGRCPDHGRDCSYYGSPPVGPDDSGILTFEED